MDQQEGEEPTAPPGFNALVLIAFGVLLVLLWKFGALWIATP